MNLLVRQSKLRAVVVGIYDCKGENFGNAREMRTLFEATVQAQADCLASQENISSEQLQTFQKGDIEAVGHSPP